MCMSPSPMPWGQCMSESTTRAKAEMARVSEPERWRAANRFRCELAKEPRRR
jgi:hypothetical protein